MTSEDTSKSKRERSDDTIKSKRKRSDDTSKSNRKRSRHHSDHDEWIDADPTTKGHLNTKSVSAHRSERSTKSSHSSYKGEDPSTKKKTRLNDKYQDTSATVQLGNDEKCEENGASERSTKSSHSRCKGEDHSTKKKARLNDKDQDTSATVQLGNDEKSRGGAETKNESYDQRKISPDSRKKNKSKEDCEENSRIEGQHQRTSATRDKKSPDLVTMSDVERSVNFEARVLHKRMRMPKIDDSKLRDMYDLDCPPDRKTRYQPQNWTYDQHWVDPSYFPSTFSVRYYPERNSPEDKHVVRQGILYQPANHQKRTVSSFHPRVFSDRYDPKKDGSEDKKNEARCTPKKHHDNASGHPKRHQSGRQ